MKKVFLTLAFVAAAFFCQAQLFVGGSLGIGTGGGSSTETTTSGSETETVEAKAPKTFSFSINPTLGYMLNDKLGAGITLGYGIYNTTEKGEDYKHVAKSPSWEIAPFVRYILADWNAVSLYADFVIGLSGNKEKYIAEGTQGGTAYNTETEGPKTFNFGVSVVPGLAYNLTDNISVNANVNLLSLGYQMSKTTMIETSYFNDDKVETINKTNAFGLGVNKPTAVEIGFFYTF